MTTTAVPCWSSWKTGMSSSSLSVSSISKQRGRGDVLEVDPAEGRGDELDGLDDLRGIVGVEADRKGVDLRELLEEHRLALHHRHRRLGADVAESEHRGAVGDHGDGVRLDRVVEGLGLVLGDVLADAGDARRVGHREVVAGLQRVLVVLLDLALLVHLEGAVGEAEYARAARRPDRAQDLLPLLRAVGVDRELANPLALGPGAGNQVDRLQRATGLSDLRSELAERLLARIELDADGDAVLGGGSHRRRQDTRGRISGSRGPNTSDEGGEGPRELAAYSPYG